MLYLIIGINLLMVGSCEGETEYRFVTEFQFENKTDNAVEFEVFATSANRILLNAHKMTEIVRIEVDGGPKNPDIKNCCQGILDDLLGSSGKLYRINGTECFLHEDEKSDLIGNYHSQVISARVFRYTYNFTAEDFEGAESCE